MADDVKTINYWLERDYGTVDNRPWWRVVWGDDEFENKLVTHTPEGMQLLYPEVMNVPKYWPFFKARHILEFLTDVPIQDMQELPENLYSYEPRYVFQDKAGNPLPPRYDVCTIIIKSIHDRMGYKGKRYKDPYGDPKTALDVKLAELVALEEYLFSNETEVGDALAYKEGVSLSGPKLGDTDVNQQSVRIVKPTDN